MGAYSELETIALIVAVVLLVAVVLWRVLARRSSARRQTGSLRLALDRLESDREDSWLALLEKEYSAFVRFFRFVQDELGAKTLADVTEIDAALNRLKNGVAECEKRGPHAPANGDHRSTGDQGSAIRAAALTIVREVYGRPEWLDQLSDEGRREMDKLVDSLTEEP